MEPKFKTIRTFIYQNGDTCAIVEDVLAIYPEMAGYIATDTWPVNETTGIGCWPENGIQVMKYDDFLRVRAELKM